MISSLPEQASSSSEQISSSIAKRGSIQLSKNPPRGTYDLYPRDLAIRQYIFNTWRRVCQSFGYEEYLGPIVEDARIWEAKSGEDVGGSELTRITDRDGKPSELALRPEMTPTVTRMVAKIYDGVPKPIRYFSIANFYRNERPQRGRNREFWQLNFDLFGSDLLEADIEIAMLAMEIIFAFSPPKNAFCMNLNNRKLLDAFFSQVLTLSEEKKVGTVRIMDKWKKLSREDFVSSLEGVGLTDGEIASVVDFLISTTLEEIVERFPVLAESQWVCDLQYILESLSSLGYGAYVRFAPDLIRGFDYYDGMIFEVFDCAPENTRAMFGGGRYNGLANIFGSRSFPAVGSGPGDETFRLFLESWGLLPDIEEKVTRPVFYLPILFDGGGMDIQKIAQSLRLSGKDVEVGLARSSLGKSLEYALKKEYAALVIYGENEAWDGVYRLKDLRTREETVVSWK